MKILDDIRNQPQGTREIMFSLSVFITVLMVGFVWFHSFQRNLYVLLNPEDGLEKALAVESAPVPSLFSFIGQSAGEVKGLVFGLLGNQETLLRRGFGGQTGDEQGRIKIESGKVYTLPLSERK